MTLDYIRQDTILTQDELYNYTALGESRDLNPLDVEKILNHFKPTAYNFSIIAKSDILEALRDITHWMDYEVPGTSVPNTAAVISTFGNYDNWMVVRGAAASQDPNANQNMWQPANFTVYGFWLNDPAVSGIGENSYKTAAELQSTYYLPMATLDTWSGKFVGIAEPPEVLSQAKVEIAQPRVNELHSELGVVLRSSSISGDTVSGSDRVKLNKFNWKEIIDPHLLKGPNFKSVFEGAIARKPLKVTRLDSQGSYYLIAFGKKHLTSLVLIIDGSNSVFKEASWVKNPVEYPRITKQEAIQLVLKNKYPAGRKIVTEIKAELVWEPGAVSSSPYRPMWRIIIENETWFVTDEGEVLKNLLHKILD